MSLMAGLPGAHSGSVALPASSWKRAAAESRVSRTPCRPAPFACCTRIDACGGALLLDTAYRSGGPIACADVDVAEKSALGAVLGGPARVNGEDEST
jgi:hypothetical protein